MSLSVCPCVRPCPFVLRGRAPAVSKAFLRQPAAPCAAVSPARVRGWWWRTQRMRGGEEHDAGQRWGTRPGAGTLQSTETGGFQPALGSPRVPAQQNPAPGSGSLGPEEWWCRERCLCCSCCCLAAGVTAQLAVTRHGTGLPLLSRFLETAVGGGLGGGLSMHSVDSLVQYSCNLPLGSTQLRFLCCRYTILQVCPPRQVNLWLQQCSLLCENKPRNRLQQLHWLWVTRNGWD